MSFSAPKQRILIVDDDPSLRRLLARILEHDYELQEAPDGQAALAIVAEWQPDLVLLDIVMPGVSGLDVCSQIKETYGPAAPQVLILSAQTDKRTQTAAFANGADDYVVKPVNRFEISSRVAVHLELMASRRRTLALEDEISGHHAELKTAVGRHRERIMGIQDVAIFTLAKLSESRDNDTGQHLMRMREYSVLVAEELSQSGPYTGQVDQQFIDDLYRSAPLHDIGKVAIPDRILLKPGKLTDEEFAQMKRHTIVGGNVLHDAVMQLEEAGFLAMAAQIALAHHERWDGRGYPAGLRGDEIPLAARIVSVADVYDALTSERPYKEPWPANDAREMIEQNKGTMFDPACVDAFARAFERVYRYHSKSHAQPTEVRGATALLEQLELAGELH